MKRLMTLFLLLGSVGFPALTQADHPWGTYHWARTNSTFTLKLGDNVSLAWGTFLQQASGDWSKSGAEREGPLFTDVVWRGTQSDPKKCRPTAGQVEVCNANYGGAWVGLAQIWIGSGHIYQGTAKMNDFYFSKPKYNTPAWKRFVMCQEVGHTFGLDHQDENFSNGNLGSCMDYTNDPGGLNGGLSNEHPNDHDYVQLESIYTHLDTTTSATQLSAKAPSGMNDLDLSEPRAWGRLVRSTNRGQTEVYERDFGGGHKIFTFVIWPDRQDRGRGNQH